MKIRITMVVEWNVELEHYPDAKNVEDIARIQQQYFRDGTADRHEAIDCEGVTITVEPVKKI